MQSSSITAVFLPVALAIIMLGLGLSLTKADFKRVATEPRAVFVGLFCQAILLPLACFGIARGFGLPPELAVGLMLLSATPGGATANLFSHLAKGDVALNITLTATNSIVSLFTLPFIVNASLAYFMGEGRAIPLQPDKVIQVFAIVLVPVGIGMLVRAKKLTLAQKLERPVRTASAIVLALVIVAAVLKERANIGGYFQQAGLAALAFNLTSMAVGYVVPLLAKVPRRQAVAIGMEIGVHNGTLAITIASSPLLLNNSAMSIPAVIYSLVMFFTAGAFGWFIARRAAAEAASVPPPAPSDPSLAS